MRIKPQKHQKTAFTIVELVVTLAIIGTLAIIAIATLSGLKPEDAVDRAAQSIYEDLILIRSRSVSTNQDHRLNFVSASQWKVESYNASTTVWSQVGDIRNMPSQTNLTTSTFANAGANLTAVPRGLFVFSGSTVGTPYVTITSLGASKTKSLYVDVGGSIDLRTP